MDMLTNRAMEVTKLALDGLVMRQQAISSNTANVMTPDYQRKDVVFEDQLQQMLEKDNLKKELKTVSSAYYAHNSLDTVQTQPLKKLLAQNSFQGYNPEIISDSTSINPETGNNVNMEAEMMSMAKTGLQYNILTTLEGKMFQQMKDVIKGGGS